MRAASSRVRLFVLFNAAVFGQSQNQLSFEVAALRPSQPGLRGGGVRPAPGGQRYVGSNTPLKPMIWVAYRLKPDQVVGGPDWIDTEPYDMNAEASRPSSIDELHIMLQNLLVERFRLRFHHETKELPVYALTVDKNARKSLKAHEAQNASDIVIDQVIEGLHEKWSARFAPINFLAWRLSLVLDRPVIDHTNLKGGYDFDLAFTHEPPLGVPLAGAPPPGNIPIDPPPTDASGPTIIEALRKQLGLKLEAQKGPVDILVIDHAERPSAN